MKSHESLTVRPERQGDRDAIRHVIIEAFGQPGEADLVDALRRSDHLAISLVAAEDDIIVGHIAFSPVTLNALPGPASLVFCGFKKNPESRTICTIIPRA